MKNDFSIVRREGDVSSGLEEKRILLYAGLFFLFPVGMGSVHHYASTLFVLMLLAGFAVLLLGKGGALSFDKKLPAIQIQIIIAVSLFLFVISLSLFNAVDLRHGVKILSKMTYLVALIPLYYATRRVSGRLLNSFMLGLVCTGPVTLLIALYSVFVLGLPRAQGYYSPIVFGDLSLLGAMLLSAYVFSGGLKGRLISPLGTLSILCLLLSCYLSGTRGAWITLPAALSVALLLHRHVLTKEKIIQMVLGLVFLLCTISIYHIYVEQDIQIEGRGMGVVGTVEKLYAFSSGEELNSSVGQRLLMWGIAVDMMQSKPLLGFGLGGFRGELERLQRENKTRLNTVWPHAHSIYFEFLATTGILGLLSMVAGLFIVPAMVFVKSLSGSDLQRRSASAGLVFLTCFAVFGLTECWLFRSSMLISYIVCLLIFTTGCVEKDSV